MTATTRALPRLIAFGMAALPLSACSSEQVAHSFGNWCKRTATCTDNSRTQP